MKKIKDIPVNVKIVTIILIVLSFFLFIKNLYSVSMGAFARVSVQDGFNVPLGASYQIIPLDNGDAFIYRSHAIKYYDLKNNKIRTVFDSDANKILSNSACAKLNDGNILITGGGSPMMKKILSNTSIFLPETRQIKKGPDMLIPRAYHSAVTLDDGRVLISGGKTGKMAYWPDVSDRRLEFYNPKTNEFEYGPALPDTIYGHMAVKLNDGNVLIIGGRIEGDFKEGNKNCYARFNRDIILYNVKLDKIELIGRLDKFQAVFEVFCIDDKIYIVSKEPAEDAFCTATKKNDVKYKNVIIKEFFYDSKTLNPLGAVAFQDKENFSSMLLSNDTLFFYKNNSKLPFSHAIIFDPKTKRMKSVLIKTPLFYTQNTSAILKDNAVLTIGLGIFYNERALRYNSIPSCH